jgi:hypothetical protein
MAPFRSSTRGAVEAEEFPADTYGILPKELSDLSQVHNAFFRTSQAVEMHR